MEERLYSQLTNARLMRDRLGATLEQWRICGLLLKASSMAANQGLKQWQKVKIIVCVFQIKFFPWLLKKQ